MSKNPHIITSRHNTARGQHRSYVTGFVLSLLLTIIPYILVANKLVWGWALFITLMIFALLQVVVQLKFFIHLGHEQKPRWNWIVFAFMLLILLIIVIGSLWIMRNLDYNMMHQETGGRVIQDEGL